MRKHTRAGLPRMLPRDPAQTFRSSSPLELFFDLIFVVAVSLSSAQLHHAESEAHIGAGVLGYLMVFFGIWWAWMNFTWFASAFDTDDWFYRLLTLTQMAGVLLLAVGTAPAMQAGDFGLMILGYVVMRLALVVQWLRASRSHPGLRRTALRYALGVTLCQAGWIAFLWVPGEWALPAFAVLAIGELAVPVWAESIRQTPWHPGHITDRYGSFTLIVLGESVLASTVAVASAAADSDRLGEIAAIGFTGLALAAGMWWLYFAADVADRLTALRSALPFGYGHYIVFASAGAFSAGISVVLDAELGDTAFGSAVSDRIAAAATLTVPIALFVLGVWLLILRHHLRGPARVLVLIGAVAIAACALLPWAMLFAAIVMAALVALVERERRIGIADEDPAAASEPEPASGDAPR